jgi:VanZ family protein
MWDRLPQLYRQLARWLFIPAIALVVWGELKPSHAGIENGFDKVLHFTAYFGLAGIATVALGRLRPAIWVAIGLASFGGILEIVQSFVGRDAEWGDEFANMVGACAGLLAGWQTIRAVRWLISRGNERRGHSNVDVR